MGFCKITMITITRKLNNLDLIITTFVILQLIGSFSLALPDPCPSHLHQTTVADMCKETTAEEEPIVGSEAVDSVIMRVITQEDNCVCQVTFPNETVKIVTKKYGGLVGTSPVESPCGLHIQMELINQSFKLQTKQIKCSYGLEPRYFALERGGVLQFTSKVTEGEFARGYCIQISRASISTNTALKLSCSKPLKGSHFSAVPDPCPSDLPYGTVAGMCTETTAIEDSRYGSEYVDSVVMRVITQEDNCVCQVTYQDESVQIVTKKYNGLTVSAPETSICGLHIYMEFLNQSTKPQTEPIKCTTGLKPHYFGLEKGGVLQFTSKVTKGDFTRGYCLQISRDRLGTGSSLKLSCSKTSTGTLPSERTSSTPHVNLWTSDNTHQIITDKPPASEPKLNIVIGVVACVVAVIVILSAMFGILYTRRNKKKANDAISTNRDQKYDVLSISRDVSTYSSLTTPETQEQEYEIVFPRGDTNDI